MSLVDYLFTNRTPMDLAKELARTAHENAALRDKLGAAELELFWMKAAEREPAAQASAAPDAIDAARYQATREALTTFQLDYYYLEGRSAEEIDAYVDARLAATESNKGE